MIIIAFMILFAVLNRARGSALFNACSSTVVTRLISMGAMALLTSFLMPPEPMVMFKTFAFTLAGLMLWCTPGWDKYWGAEIGQSPHTKLWGCVCMFLRQLLILPTFIGLAYINGGNIFWSAMSCTLWIPYIAWGIIYQKNPIPYAEYMVGAMIGFTIFMIMG